MLRFMFIMIGSFTCYMALNAAQPGPEFDSYVYPNDDLGAVHTPTQTTLKLWAPTASSVAVLLFDSPAGQSSEHIAMQRDEHGIWSASLKGDRDGKYYLYDIVHGAPGSGEPAAFRVNDPYARGCSVNTGRTLIYNPSKTNPDGWETDQFVTLKHNVDACIYEVHIRDFSINKASGIPNALRGKYLGMVQEGTRTPEGEKSGLDHLKELGISHVHLLPVHEYATGDETQSADTYTWYDWGYGPVLFNTPEGSYATDPNGTTRQKEFKQMVQAFHRQHIGVVLDVVFNHTAQTGRGPASVFDKVYPHYYYRQDASGRYANATGCGNEFASERPMARKFIVDSVKYWMREYHVDGFRFDLMGIEDRETMLAVYREARKINPNALIYGEGWDMERVLPPDRMMTQAHVQGTGIAAFNDGIRDNIKGDAGHGRTPGFVQGAGAPYGGLERFCLNLKGQSTGKGGESIPVFSPNETINYDSAHDDHCLWDKLLLSAPNVPEALRINMDKLAAGIVLTAQGVPFLHAGDEFLRSKQLNKNSYNSNDPRVNPIDWSLKAKHQEVFRFYQGLIALRRAHPAFRMTDKAAVDAALEFAKEAPRNVVVYVLKNHANGDSWRHILVVYNGRSEAQEVHAPGDWQIVADDKAAGTVDLRTARNNVRAEPFSLVIAHTEGECELNAQPALESRKN